LKDPSKVENGTIAFSIICTIDVNFFVQCSDTGGWLRGKASKVTATYLTGGGWYGRIAWEAY